MMRGDEACGLVGFDALVDVLKAGRPAIFPTDTVVGLGVAVAYCPSPQVLFDLKGRPAGKPVAWLVADAAALDEFGEDVPRRAREAVAAHWPGALTVIVKAGADVAPAYRSDFGTIGLRMPASDEVRRLIRALGCPLATTSANLSGVEPPRTTAEVAPALLARVAALRSPACGTGLASTVIDFTSACPHTLRP